MSADQVAAEQADAQNTGMAQAVAPQIAKGAMDAMKNPQNAQATQEAMNGSQ
jgi:hypothetical protein